jgi:hypothetical protein
VSDLDEDFTYLEGPVEKIDGELVLLIPLEAGGDQLIECSRGISALEGEFLKVVIKDWLAVKLGIDEGSKVAVDNRNGKFNITVLNPISIQ